MLTLILYGVGSTYIDVILLTKCGRILFYYMGVKCLGNMKLF